MPTSHDQITRVLSFTLGGVDVELTREVVQRIRDQAYGEVRRPLRVVPELEVAAAKDLIGWPISEQFLWHRLQYLRSVSQAEEESWNRY